MNLVPFERAVRRRRFRKILGALILISLALGIIVVPIEQLSGHPNVKIHTLFDGLWWAVQTVTTVGYGDYVPVSVAGRVVGMILQLVGGLAFGIVIAIISVELTNAEEHYYWKRTMTRLDRIEKHLEEVSRHSRFLVRSEQESSPHRKPEKKE
jgi:voltage-gated potassium channel